MAASATTRIVMRPGWESQLQEPIDRMKQALADQISADARDKAPVLSGFLRDNIDSTMTETGFTVNAHAPYAAYVELGTSRTAAQPFLLPALYTKRAL